MAKTISACGLLNCGWHARALRCVVVLRGDPTLSQPRYLVVASANTTPGTSFTHIFRYICRNFRRHVITKTSMIQERQWYSVGFEVRATKPSTAQSPCSCCQSVRNPSLFDVPETISGRPPCSLATHNTSEGSRTTTGAPSSMGRSA
jgi:hypothetical protein